MRDETTLTDAEIEARFDALGYVCTVDDLTFTRDTMADFRVARLGYAKPGTVRCDDEDGMILDDVQTAAGQPRRALYIVDLGAVRAVAR